MVANVNRRMTSFISYEDIYGNSELTAIRAAMTRVTHVECVVDQILADTSEHVQAAEDVLHVVVHIGQVNLGLVAHVPLHLDRGVEKL